MKNIVLAFSVLGLMSCKHEIKNQATPEVSFTKDIQPIIVSNCTMSGCHGSENTSEFTLLTYDDVMLNGEIKANLPFESDLFEKITDIDQDDIMPPPPYQPLSQEQIALIEKWIKEGAKNN